MYICPVLSCISDVPYAWGDAPETVTLKGIDFGMSVFVTPGRVMLFYSPIYLSLKFPDFVIPSLANDMIRRNR
jgi:hypothetical protein